MLMELCMSMAFEPRGRATLDSSEAVAEIERLDALSSRVYTRCGGDSKMVWRRWGEGPPVVLIHGGAGSWMHWIRNIEFLARTRTVWAPDLPGFGDSDLPGDNFDADTLAPLVQDGMQEVLNGSRFDLVGFSFGALVSSLIAAKAPNGVERLILVSVAALGIVSAPPAIRSMRGVQDPQERADVFRFNLNAIMLHDPASIDELALTVQGRSAPRDRVKDRTLALTDAVLRVSREWDCDAYGIWGCQDAIYRDRIDTLQGKIEELGLREAVLLENAGHWLQFECAEEFNHVLSRFLAEPLHHG
jgi:2-hydroxy-6-oxonona-2,4-dienedioate hydrolase